jgi:adenosylcobinamide-phosphate synthase
MFGFDLSWFLDSVAIFALSFFIDVVFGEYPDRVHPTIGIGKIITFLKRKAKNPNPKLEKANGVLLALSAILVVALPVFVLLFGLKMLPFPFGDILFIVVGAILFKARFAIKGMGY